MPKSSNKLTADQLGRFIYEIRGRRVMLDSDLAVLYGVPTKRLNEQYRRNRKRFPEDFAFQLRAEEARIEVANCDLKITWWAPLSSIRLHRTRRAAGRQYPEQRQCGADERLCYSGFRENPGTTCN